MKISNVTLPDYQEMLKGNTKRRFHFSLAKMLGGIGWIIVVVCALALSAWSLFYVGRHYGLPIPLAAIVSTAFDGAAIVCADLALKYARTHGDGGFGPRMGVFGIGGLSAYLNMQHAIIANDPFAARILYAVPPITAVVLFEFHSRYERRGALKSAGRIAKSLPVFGRWAWILFPIRTVRTMRSIVDNRSTQIANRELPVTTDDSDYDTRRISINPREVRAWAIGKGIQISDRGRIPGVVTMAYLAELTENQSAKTGNASALGPNVALISTKWAPKAAISGTNPALTDANEPANDENDLESEG
jgi:Protein of unknown function (DUF2637)